MLGDKTPGRRVVAARFHSGWRALTWLLQFRRGDKMFSTSCAKGRARVYDRRSHFQSDGHRPRMHAVEHDRECSRRRESYFVFIRVQSRLKALFDDQDRCWNDRGPETTLVADSGLRDVGCPDDFVGDPVEFLLFVPGLLGIELNVERGSQHFRREFFSVLAVNVVGLAKREVLAEVSLGIAAD